MPFNFSSPDFLSHYKHSSPGTARISDVYTRHYYAQFLGTYAIRKNRVSPVSRAYEQPLSGAELYLTAVDHPSQYAMLRNLVAFI